MLCAWANDRPQSLSHQPCLNSKLLWLQMLHEGHQLLPTPTRTQLNIALKGESLFKQVLLSFYLGRPQL